MEAGMRFCSILAWILIFVQNSCGHVQNYRGHVQNSRERVSSWEMRPRRETGGERFTCPAFFSNPNPNNVPTDDFWLPPTFSTCPPATIEPTYYVPEGEDGVIVTWSEPVAKDTLGSKLRVVQVRGGASGTRFPGGVGGRRHDVVYLARDKQGLSSNCFFSFTVTVMTCAKPAWPSNGHLQCSNHNLPGSSCNTTCVTGYQVSGPSKVTCINNNMKPTWTALPQCEKVVCGPPPPVLHGSFNCTGSSYLSYCKVSCDAGFTLQGSQLTTCEAYGTWSVVKAPVCKDITPPSISCLSPQITWAERSVNHAFATWTDPTAVDNVDANPGIVLVSGPTQGSQMAAGTSQNVTYKAMDEAGNESPECTIEVRVHAIACGHPLDVMSDGNLTHSCTLTSFTWGDQCTLSCNWNLPLEGSRILTCERNNTGARPSGYWSWGTGDQPYCKFKVCHDLDPPRNGYLDISYISKAPAATLHCPNVGDVVYEVPVMETRFTFTGLILCHDSGWSPFTRTPDCIVPKKPKGFQLDSIISFYDGLCSEADLDTITTELQAKLDNVTRLFQTVCPANVTCAASNLVISCPQGRKRRELNRNPSEVARGGTYLGLSLASVRDEARRSHALVKRQTSTNTLIVSFSIDTDFIIHNMTGEQPFIYAEDIQHNTLQPVLQTMIDEGSFNLTSWSLRSDSLWTAQLSNDTCDVGYISARSLVCHPCPIGYYLENSKCVECLIGQYNNVSGAVTCTSCPDGFSTKQTRSEFITNCTKLCSPGTYSPDTFEPCAPCQRGYYQPNSGQTNCLPCPSWQTTIWHGSASNESCTDVDVSLDDTFASLALATLASVSDFTVSVWMKNIGKTTPDVNLKISNGSTDVISISVTDNVRVSSTWFPSLDTHIGSVFPDAWVHVDVAVDRQNKRAFAYFDGQLKATEVNQQIGVATTSALQVYLSTSVSGLILSGLRIQGHAANITELTESMTTCHTGSANNLLDAGTFKYLNEPGVNIVVPSMCSVFNHCRKSPCGNHTCVNSDANFTCLCNNGWSGSTCNIPPDYCTDNACRNNASCISGEESYTCECKQGYTGTFCEITPVNGGWSEWSLWTECTVTCGTGTRERSRSCDSPEPGQYGDHCLGDETQTGYCNTELCPECSLTVIANANRSQCNDEVDAGHQCIVQCKPGYVLPGYLDGYRFRCGLATGFSWLPSPYIPDCVYAFTSHTMTLTTETTYTSDISQNSTLIFKERLRDNMEHTMCFNYTNCSISIDILDGLAGSFRVRVHLETVLSERGYLEYVEYLTRGSVTATLQELIDVATILKSSAQTISSTNGSIFDVVINGQPYTAESRSLMLCGDVTCDTGMAPAGCFCGYCPAGSYLDGHVCRLCDRGTYQPQPGMTECIPCPLALATPSAGATSSSHCSEKEMGDISTTASSAITAVKTTIKDAGQTTPGGGPNNDNNAIFIGSGIAALSLCISVAAVVIVVCRKRGAKRSTSATTEAADIRCQDGVSDLSSLANRLSQGQSTRCSNTYADINDIDLDRSDQARYNTPNDFKDPPPYAEISDQSCCRIDPTGTAYYYTSNQTYDPPPYKERDTKAGSDEDGATQRPRSQLALPDRTYMSMNAQAIHDGEDDDILDEKSRVQLENGNNYLTPNSKQGAVAHYPGCLKSQDKHTGYDYVRPGNTLGNQEVPTSNGYLTPADVSPEAISASNQSDEYMSMGQTSEKDMSADSDDATLAVALPEHEYTTLAFKKASESSSKTNNDTDYLTKVIMFDDTNK